MMNNKQIAIAKHNASKKHTRIYSQDAYQPAR